MAAVVVAGLATGCDPMEPYDVPYAARELPEDFDADEGFTLSEQQLRLRREIHEVPDTVLLGDDLRYVIELANDSGTPVFLDPCPVYYQAWGESGFAVSRISYLNCAEAPPEIQPGSSIRFEMKLPLEDPEAVSVAGSIVWYLGHPDGELRQDVGVSDVIDVVER